MKKILMNILVNLIIILNKEMEHSIDSMEKNTSENGKMDKCMVKEKCLEKILLNILIIKMECQLEKIQLIEYNSVIYILLFCE